MSFKVGDKVVCLKNGKCPLSGRRIIKGEIYTVQGLSIAHAGCICLYEFPDPQFPRQPYCAADAKYFRKLDYDFVEEVIEKIKEQPVEV